ncbi:hypothetical protein [Pseudarthrobacter sp.]|uniref:hypothetical protein n=1 Tax=Pseudarthrobacter sp. TaxID=1934409 RepID=UPI002FC9751E
MSNLLHDSVNVGVEVVLSAPFGDVVMEYTDRPVVLASAGIGIRRWQAGCPAWRKRVRSEKSCSSMATWLLTAPGPIETEASHRDVFSRFMDVREVDLPEDAEYYLCGPVVFMQSVRTALVARGVPPKDIQYEVFGPAEPRA